MLKWLGILSLSCAVAAAACSNGQSTPPVGGDKQAAPSATPPPSSPPAQQPSAAPAQPGAQPSEPPKAQPSEPVEKSQPASSSPSSAGAPAAAASTASSIAPAPAKPAEPAYREVTVPASTSLSLKLDTPLSSETARVEDPVRATLTRSIIVSGVTVAPAGSELTGVVTDAKRSGRVKGRASISFRFNELTAHGERYAIRTSTITRLAAVKRKEDVKKGAIGGAAGAIVGGLLGGGKGAVLGGAAGATGTVLATRGEELHLPVGTAVSASLQKSFTVQAPVEKR